MQSVPALCGGIKGSIGRCTHSSPSCPTQALPGAFPPAWAPLNKPAAPSHPAWTSFPVLISSWCQPKAAPQQLQLGTGAPSGAVCIIPAGTADQPKNKEKEEAAAAGNEPGIPGGPCGGGCKGIPWQPGGKRLRQLLFEFGYRNIPFNICI